MLTAELHERINKLSYVKRQLLNEQLQLAFSREGAGGAAGAAISRAPAAGGHALSYTQERVLRTQAAFPAATFYNQPQVLRVDGPLDVRALVQALHYLAARHDVLHPGSAATLDLQYQDLAAAPSASGPAAGLTLEELLHQHTHLPFDLTTDLPLSALLLRLAPQRYVLSLVHHFVAFDYWSIALFNRELSLAYVAYASGLAPHLPPLPFTYAGYAAWQRSPAETERLGGLSHYWRRQLARLAAPVAPGPTAPRPTTPGSFAADSFEFCVPAAALRRLERLAQRENATLFMLLLGSLQVLLARYTGRTELAVGTTVANRHPLETEALLGNFSNRLLLWGGLAGNPTFRQLLRRVRGSTLNAYTRQEVPLDRMAELTPCAAASAGLFEVMLDYVNAPLPPPALRGTALSRLLQASDQSEYPLHVTAQRNHDHLRVRLLVRANFAAHTSVGHMAYHWNTLLAAIADNPEQRVESLPLTKNLSRTSPASGWWAGNALSNSPPVRL